MLRLLPIMLVAAAPEYLSGAITGIWPIYLASLGAEGWQIGLSFTLFALPAVLLSVPYGALVDRLGGRVVMTASLIAIAGRSRGSSVIRPTMTRGSPMRKTSRSSPS